MSASSCLKQPSKGGRDCQLLADYRLTLPSLADPLRFLTLFSQMSIARSEATRCGRDYWQPSHTVNPFSTGRAG